MRRLNFKVDTLDSGDLALSAFQGHEEVSRLFWFDLDLLSEKLDIDPTKLVGHKVSFAVKFDDDSPRYFNGYVSQFSSGAVEDRQDSPDDTRTLRHYHARVVPWLWFLTRRSNCRIFFNKSVPEIIEQVFNDAGFSGHWQSKLENEGSYPKREYCVQYRETDFNFVSRLMEEEGIFYCFTHDAQQHKLILGNSSQAWSDCKDVQLIRQKEAESITQFEFFSHWEHAYQVRSGKWSQTDYNFKESRTSLVKQEPTKFSVQAGEIDNSKYELFDYPGFLDTHGGNGDTIEDGTRLTKIRMEEEETGYNTVRSSSTYRSFGAGGRFTIGEQRAPNETKGSKFVITSIQHVAHETTSYFTGGVPSRDYSNTFTCIPDDQEFRPARLTPKPVVHGAQTALVVGPSGEEIYCDEFGRVKVEFFWDRAGKSPSQPEERSCWVRVASNYAGKQWGFVALPRIGQEVVVEYLEGDPDRPLIVGSVYNDSQKLHYSLAEGADRDKNKTKTYFVTNSSAGGEGYNELMFDDKKGSEQVFVHSERNMDVRVKNDSKERVIGNRHEIIGDEKDGSSSGSQYQLIHKDKHLHVKGDQVEKVEGNMQFYLGGGQSGDGSLDDYISGNKTQQVGKNYGLTIAGARAEKVGSDLSLNVTGSQNVKVGMTSAMEAGQTIHIKAGMTLILEAGMQLSLKVGGTFIDIGPTGVSIVGTMVMINSGGAAGSGPGASPVDPAQAKQAAPTDPDQALDGFSGSKSADS